jgi:AraC-like DNA-binding protein
MLPDDAAVFAVRLAIVSVSFVGGAVYLLQRRLSPVFGVSSFMFLAFGASQLVYVVETLWPSQPDILHHAIHMVSYVAAFFLLPTFFIHLRLLTRNSDPIGRGELFIHLALPTLVTLLAIVTLFIPGDSLAALKAGQPVSDAALWMRATVSTLLLLELGGYTFVLIYIWLLFKWQRCSRVRMRRLFASGDRYEPFWTFGLAAIMALYVVQVLIAYFFRDGILGHPVGPIENSTIALVFILLVAIRGLQQAPGLLQPAQTDIAESARKYSKSALVDEHAARIARKLNSSMSQDSLYRDENLSLAKLAKHIGASPNYVSQTLNEHMETSFFDFLNLWRINEAKVLLRNSNETILSIAHKVGFNSRSAFYAAFKKHAGMTPSDYRASDLDPQPIASSKTPYNGAPHLS